jgi:hypothetical protein
VSCNHSRRPKIHPHCGTCSQCVDRRFSVAFTGLEKYEDESLGYEKDIFVDELTEGEERMQAMSPVQFSLAIKAYDVNTFCSKYVQVYDAIDSLEGDEEQNLQAIYDLHLRFANEIHDVMSQKHARNWEKLFNHELPATCLLMLTGPRAHRRSSPMIARQAEILIQRLESCPVTVIKPFEDLCEDIFTFLFCEDVPAEEALRRPNSQFGTDQGYERRDLVFRNQASRGFWAQIRSSYEAEGIVLDAKNYKDELDADTVRGFSSKYLKSRGLGLFGVLVARKVPSETRINVATSDRVPGVVHAQKVEWQTNGKMIVLLDDEDVKQMLRMKAEGQNPTELLDDRIYTLKARM